MKRAHMLRTSSDIIFVDTTSACDPQNHAITFMLAPCAVGAVSENTQKKTCPIFK